MENSEKLSHIDKIIIGILKKAMRDKLIKNRTISLDAIYLLAKNYLPFLERPIFLSKGKKILAKWYVKLSRLRKNKKLNDLQNKFPELNIAEAYFYLELQNKFRTNQEDIQLFEDTIKILLSKKIDFKDEEDESNKQYKLCQ